MKWSDLSFFKTQYPYIRTFINEEVDKGKSILPRSTPPLKLRGGDDWQGPTLFNAFIATPRDKVKVVILGQDPYPNKENAMGLAFSVPENVPVPASLQNIYKELQDDVGVVRKNGSLIDWAKQGVLLLNSSLTVEEGKSGSHAYIGWHELTKEVISTLSEESDGIVFILWGSYAQGYDPYIKHKERHMVIKSPHPSPLSANKGFFGSKPFSKTNFFLESIGKSPIKW